MFKNTNPQAISFINRLLLGGVEMSVVSVFVAISIELFGFSSTRDVLCLKR
ncbi:hypothetical protein C942_00432 [Photobacterium marinum]|uniref:Uncharacterized protein n=1 Tax=Photobacterium marinum TaxID=1056511 RepID=L8JCI0_9GAMM|nr:hypothetical protein C942_00432 [Photobacterium marinum]